MARLIWKKTDSPDDDIAFDLGETPLVVGRDPKCGVFINAPLLSREHARIDFRDGAHCVVYLDSPNFTISSLVTPPLRSAYVSCFSSMTS